MIPGASSRSANWSNSAALAPGCDGLAECLLRLLERFGAASQLGTEWRLEKSSALPDIGEVWRLLLADAPDLVAELALTASSIENLTRALTRGAEGPETALSPLTEHLLHASPVSAAEVNVLCDALYEVAASWPRGRPLRILEFGAINGGTTRRVLDRLAQTGVALSYLATTADPDQAARLAFLAESYIGATALHWSPHDGVKALEGAAFDIVLAVNACARLQLDRASLECLRNILTSGGLFLAAEPDPNALWSVVLGDNLGWWQAGSRAAEISPLRSCEEWRAELAAAGFRSAAAVSNRSAAWPWGVFWGIAPDREDPPSSEPVARGTVLLVADDPELAAGVQESLCEAGHNVVVAPGFELPVSDADDIGEAEGREAERVLFLATGPCHGDPVDYTSRSVAALAQVATRATRRNAALWVVTCDAQQAAVGKPVVGSVGGALWGLARVLANEFPRLSIRLLDLAGKLPREEHARQIAAELAAAGADDEIVWTPEGRHVLRVRRGLPPRWAGPADLLTLGSRHPGGLDSLGWERGSGRPVGPGQIEIDVHAAGLNFRDMMWAMGLLPEEALSRWLCRPDFRARVRRYRAIDR